MVENERKYPNLFSAGEDSQMNACLNYTDDMSHCFIEGYRHAADCLVEHVAETASRQDLLVYPIAFMYRQHIELQLKKIIDTGRQLLTDDESGHPKHHKLHDLWPLAKGLMRQVWSSQPEPPEFKLIDLFIQQFATIDHDSTAFRFPIQKSGSRSLDGVKYINLRNLAECVHSFSGMLCGAAGALFEYLDEKRQWEHEARSDYRD